MTDMAWNPSPEVATARDAAKKLDDADMVVIIYAHLKGPSPKIGMASYGRNVKLCEAAGDLGEHLFDAANKWE